MKEFLELVNQYPIECLMTAILVILALSFFTKRRAPIQFSGSQGGSWGPELYRTNTYKDRGCGVGCLILVVVVILLVFGAILFVVLTEQGAVGMAGA